MNFCNGFFYYSRNDLYMIEETNNNYCVYVHTCPDGVYYGVTCNVKNRWSSSRYRNGTPFKDAITKFGWKNITHDVLFENLTRDEALKIEDELICKARTKAWREAHPEEYNAYMREYRKRKKAEKQAQQSVEEKVKPTKSKSKRKKPLF